MSEEYFVTQFSRIEMDNVFNPYKNQCAKYDKFDAAKTRRNNLRNYLRCLKAMEVDTVWMGRDLGYKGGRRTGIPLTDEMHLQEVLNVYPGANCEKATLGKSVSERTASEVWKVLTQVKKPPLLWNVFPFHPHSDDLVMSNRRHRSIELEKVDGLNRELVEWLGIKHAVSIGRDAESYSSRIGLSVKVVRHPSYGGAKEFKQAIRRIYEDELVRESIQVSLEID